MPKKLEITPKIAELIRTASDDAVDPNSVSVYEAIAINSLPLSKKNLFQGAVCTGSTLREGAKWVSERPLTNHVPMHTNHEQGEEMPVGKVFYGEVVSPNGVEELRTLFWLPNTEKVLIDKLEGGAIEEVSIGMRFKHINCSNCGWDFLGADSDPYENIYERTCKNGHVIGTDGVHAMLNGLDQWLETSLVSLGAARGAKIVSRTKSLLGAEAYNALQASGKDPVLTTLYATATHPEHDDMDLTQLVDQLTTVKASVQAKDGEIATLKLTADKVTSLQEQVSTLTAQLNEAKTGDVVALRAERDGAFEFIRSEAARLAVAVGATPPAPNTNLADLTASITESRKKLADKFPTGGRAEPITDGEKKPEAALASSFKTAR